MRDTPHHRCVPWLVAAFCCGIVSGCQVLHDDVEIVQAGGARDRRRAVELNRKGCRAFEKGHLKKAESLLQQAVLADETYGVAHNNLGLVYFEKGDLYSAAWSFQRASEAMPERGEPLNNLGMVYEAAGRLDEAVGNYLQAFDLDSDNPEYLGNLIRARLRRGDLDPSLEQQLEQLLFLETRPEWRHWAEDQRVLFLPKAIARLSDETEPEEIEIGSPAEGDEAGSNPEQPRGAPSSDRPTRSDREIPELVPPATGRGKSVLKDPPRRQVGDP